MRHLQGIGHCGNGAFLAEGGRAWRGAGRTMVPSPDMLAKDGAKLGTCCGRVEGPPIMRRPNPLAGPLNSMMIGLGSSIGKNAARMRGLPNARAAVKRGGRRGFRTEHRRRRHQQRPG